jgi:glycosyltransferase involved in cell wall biosynthesis
VVLKGFQGWVYRALMGLEAIGLCADIFTEMGYRLAIFNPSPGVPKAAMKLQRKTHIPIEFVTYDPSGNEHILRLHGQARVSIGLSMSDAISTSFLEAIMLGSFPIQSNTGCANEWIECGTGGFLVPPEDPPAIARAIRRALMDDTLVDHAAEINSKTAEQRLAYAIIQAQVIKMYRDIYESRIKGR